MNTIEEMNRVDDFWSWFDHQASFAEGWSLFDANGELQIQREDHPDDGSNPKFENDEGAWRFLISSAAGGNERHQRILKFVEEFSPEEYARVVQHTTATPPTPMS